MADTPWEPPLAGTELEHLIGALDRLRTTFRWKTDDLDAAGLQTRIGASALTLGGLLKHMAITEDFMFTRKLAGESLGEPWESLWDGTDDWDSPRPPTTRRDSSTRSGTTPSNDHARGSIWPWPVADSINSSTCPHRRDSMQICAASCAT